ncbi:hypothetical protein [Pedobacter steynii]
MKNNIKKKKNCRKNKCDNISYFVGLYVFFFIKIKDTTRRTEQVALMPPIMCGNRYMKDGLVSGGGTSFNAITTSNTTAVTIHINLKKFIVKIHILSI